MRRATPKREALDRQADKWRYEFRGRVGRCEFCGRHNHGLQVHEILRGNAYRVKAQDKAYAVLVLCAACHDEMGGMHPAQQLAILKRSRPEDFSIAKFYALAEREYPSGEDIQLWLKRLSFVPHI